MQAFLDARFSDHSVGSELPAHHPHCLGCGPDNPHGLRLKVVKAAQGVRARHAFDERHVGAPGIAHGGAVATVLDDLFGYLLYEVGALAVTRSLTIDYLAPVLLNTPYELSATIRRQDGRKVTVEASITDLGRQAVTTATALFVVVDLDHFRPHLSDRPE